jgi:hypothetical protein
MRQRWMQLAAIVVLTGGALLPALVLRAQEPGGQRGDRGQFAGMQRVMGEVTAVSGATLTVKGEDGTAVQVVTTDNTRVMKGRGITVKVSDLKVGDGVVAAGNLDAPNKTLHAAMVMAQDAAEVKKMRDNLGKTYIAGKVTAIDVDNATMTVQRFDGVSQTIGFDETTSFKRGRPGRGGFGDASASAPVPTAESITLADIKVGDNVGGQGSVKNNVFVPTVLTVGTPGQGRRRSEGGAAGAAPSSDPGSK